jgi:hypothetical protein
MITCKCCGNEIGQRIIDDVHVDGFDDADIICVKCTKEILEREKRIIKLKEEQLELLKEYHTLLSIKQVALETAIADKLALLKTK